MAAKKKTASRQYEWQKKQFKEGNCIQCGRPRQQSRYKRHCTTCGKAISDRVRARMGLKKWRPGGPGRPPLSTTRTKKAGGKRKKKE